MYCVRIRARPGTADDAAEWGGAYANCYVAFADSRGAEVLARWYLADLGWIPESVLEMHEVDPEDVEPSAAEYLGEAQTEGYCVVIHGWPAEAADGHAEDRAGWNPPGESARRLVALAGTYVDSEGRVLKLRLDRHFGWGRDETVIDGTWHVTEDELTLAQFPSEGEQKAVFDGPWRILPDALAGPGGTLHRQTE